MEYLGIASQLARLEGKVDRLLARDESPTVGVSEAMRMTGTKSRTALARALRNLGVAQFARGKWRRNDIKNAIGKASSIRMEKLQRQKRLDAEAEIKTEGQRKQPRPNPHDE